MRSRHVEGLSIKPGPTQSGFTTVFTRQAVGGVVLPQVNYLVLGVFALLIFWAGFFLFRKRSSVIKFLMPMLLR